MALDKDSLKAELRSILGDPSVAELPDTQVDYALEEALREFSRYRPQMDAVRLDINVAQTRYALPPGVTESYDVWLYPLGGLSYAQATDPLFLLLTGETVSLERAGFQHFDDLAWQHEVAQTDAGPVLDIWPEPDSSGLAVVRVGQPRTWASVSEADRDSLLLWARGACLEYIGRKRSKSVTKIPTAAGQLTLNTGYNERADGQQAKKEFRLRMGNGATMATR